MSGIERLFFNIFWEAKGAFTGEVAPNMVAELCEYVIIGHSERRQYFGETDETGILDFNSSEVYGTRKLIFTS